MTAARLSALLAAALLAAAGRADDASDKQKKAAEANLTKAEVLKGFVVETDHLILASAAAEARVKVVAASLEKTYAFARKGLRFDEKDEPWAGKLTVYHFPERREYALFMRAVAGTRPDDPTHLSTRGDHPYAASGAEVGPKATDADVAAGLAPLLGSALLTARAGPAAKVPEWVRGGYGRAAALRAEGASGKRFQAYKAAARTAVLGGGNKYPAQAADAWEADRPDADLIATSLMDYLAFGPKSADFPKFLAALRPGENGNAPPVADALKEYGGKVAAVEADWKRWVRGGIPGK